MGRSGGILTRLIHPMVAKNFRLSGKFPKAQPRATYRPKGETHPIEAVGRELRKMFSWMKQSKGDDYKEGSAARG